MKPFILALIIAGFVLALFIPAVFEQPSQPGRKPAAIFKSRTITKPTPIKFFTEPYVEVNK